MKGRDGRGGKATPEHSVFACGTWWCRRWMAPYLPPFEVGNEGVERYVMGFDPARMAAVG
jgi:hypothetical protein